MYEFTTDCLTGIEQIDNEHRELFTLINSQLKWFLKLTISMQLQKIL